MTRRLNWILLALLLVIGLPYYWFLIDNSGTVLPAKSITIVGLRQLAATIPGEAPYAVEVERTAFRRIPGNLMVAGSGMKRKLVGYMAFRLPVRGGRAVMIEAGSLPPSPPRSAPSILTCPRKPGSMPRWIRPGLF